MGDQLGVVNQILQAFGQVGAPPPVIVPVVVPVQQPAAPPPLFLQANVLLPTLDNPPQIIRADERLLDGLRQTAEQLMAAPDYVNAPAAVTALQTARNRVLTAIPVQQLALATWDALNNTVGLVPQQVRTASGYADEHPISDRLRAATNAANVHTTATNFPAVTAELQACAAEIATFTRLVQSLADQFDRIRRLYAQFPAELASDDFAKPSLRLLTKQLYDHRCAPNQWSNLCAKAEGRVTPGNADMQKLRATNADDAMQMVQRLVDAGLIGIGTHEAFYESPFDLALDHFGASWGLTSLGASGKLQWLDNWEFHIHGEAVRNPAQAITTFNIIRGHIKPTSQQRAVGASIQVTDAATLATVINSTQAKFLRWARGKEGEQILSRKKRT